MVRRLGLLLAVLLAVGGCGGGSSQTPPTISFEHATPHAPPPGFAAMAGPGPGGPTAPVVGETLTTTNGTWGNRPTSYTYQWRQCDSAGANCTDIAGATSQSYIVLPGDVAHTIRVIVTAHNAQGQASQTSAQTGVVTAGNSPFPLSVSSNGRYLQTPGGQPFLLVGDSPQSGIGDLTQTKMNSYLDDRQAHGFNIIWEWLLCDGYGSFCNSNGAAAGDGGGAIFPFAGMTSPSDAKLCVASGTPQQPCTTPNTAYFSRVHAEVQHALADGIIMALTPMPTQHCDAGTWYSAMIANGNGTTATNTQDYQYGVWLGNYFKDLPNIVWLSGNDFQCSNTTAAKNDALSIAQGIASTDPSSNALQTMEADFCGGGGYTCVGSSSIYDTGTQVGESSPQNTGWTSTVQLNSAYTYSPTYAEDLLAYGQVAKPMFLQEGNYDGEVNPYTDGCTTVRNCRLQEWWTMTSGGAGQLYGCYCTTHLTNNTTLSSIDTTAVAQLRIQTDFLNSVAWQNLVPDQTHALVTAGYGSCPTTGSVTAVTCVTDAETSDQTLAIIYVPISQQITVNLSQMSGTVTARWLDPTTGTLTADSGSPFAPGAGSHNFAGHGTNGAGNSDWVLVLQATGGNPPAIVSPPTITGTPQQGQTLTEVHGTWTNSPTSYTYQWRECNGSGASCVNAPAPSTNQTYVLSGSNTVGDTMRVVETAYNGSGASAPSTSNFTSAITGGAQACAQTFTPANVGTTPYPGENVRTALGAHSGQTICFAAGNYGEIDLYANHPGSMTTLTPVQGATVTGINFNLNGVSNVTVTGFGPTNGSSTFGGILISNAGQGNSSNITISYNAMTSYGVQVLNNAISNANIDIARNTFIGFASSAEIGRLWVNSAGNNCPDGVTIEYNYLSGGEADGIDNEGCGTKILHNDIANILEANCNGIHCDAIQDNGGGKDVEVAYNYMHNVEDCFIVNDGSTNMNIHDNICASATTYSAVQFGGAINMTMNHNTFSNPNAAILWGANHAVSGCQKSTGFTFTNNISRSGAPQVNQSNECGGTGPQGTYASEDYNLMSGGTGTHDINGSPTFSGGSSPTTYLGFQLASNSLGFGTGSGGTNMGDNDFSITPGP